MDKEELTSIYIKLSDADPNIDPQTILVINTQDGNVVEATQTTAAAAAATTATIETSPSASGHMSPTPTYAQLTTVQSHDINDHSGSTLNGKKRPNDHLDLMDDLKFDSNETKKSKLSETILNVANVSPQPVPHMSGTSASASGSTANTDEIFQILSQKIAKYCQVLADLTNCEVFFKSNLNQRTLYWGTYKMMFNYTHQGLQYDRNESLIKISGRSISNDVNNIVDELLNADNLDENQMTQNELNAYFQATATAAAASNQSHQQQQQHQSTVAPPHLPHASASTTSTSKLHNVSLGSDVYSVQDTDNIVFRDLTVYADRLDENLYAQYLEKFERVRVYNECEEYIPNDGSLYDVDNLNEILNLNDEDLYAHNDEIFMCDLCENHSYKYMLQLKLHILKEHEKVPFPVVAPYECPKCKINFDSRFDYTRHVVLCYHPDLLTCKICQQNFDSYSDYLFHTKYIHTHVYVCSVCRRKFKNVKELLDHDQLMHSKSLNYCEICYEAVKSRNDLQQHYKDKHMLVQLGDEDGMVTVKQAGAAAATQYGSILEQSMNGAQVVNVTSSHSDKDLLKESELSESNVSLRSLNDSQTSLNDSQLAAAVAAATAAAQSANGGQKLTKVQKNDLIRGLLDRKHQCKWCTQRFYTKSQLKQHESTHVNAVLYCPVCDKEFTHKDRLAGHMKCHMEPSLECKICGKKFKRLCNLYNHELVHGLTEHAFMLCQFCGRGFRSRRDYQNHVIANHRDQLMKSEVINKNGNSAALSKAANGKQLTINEAKSLFNNQITPIMNKPTKASPNSSLLNDGDETTPQQNKSDTFNYFSSLTQNTNNNSMSFVDENDLDDEDDGEGEDGGGVGGSGGGDGEDENMNEVDDEEQESKQDKTSQRQLQQQIALEQQQQATNPHVLRSSNKKNNNLSNTHLLVQAAEFVDNNKS